MTEPGGAAWRQTTFFPFSITSRLAGRHAVRLAIESPTFTSERFGEVGTINGVATVDDDGTSVFLVNRSLSDAQVLEIDVTALGSELSVRESHLIADDDIYAANTLEDPERVAPRQAEATIVDGVLRVTMPAVSWVALRLG